MRRRIADTKWKQRKAMSKYSIEFSVDWVHGWQRAGTNMKTKKHFTQERTRNDETEIGIKYSGASIRKYGHVVMAPRGVPVHVKMDFYKKEPKSFPRNLPKWLKPIIPFVVKIDIDNGAKCVLDGLNGVGWYDDAQVVTLFARKQDRNGVTYDHTDVTVVWESGE